MCFSFVDSGQHTIWSKRLPSWAAGQAAPMSSTGAKAPTISTVGSCSMDQTAIVSKQRRSDSFKIHRLLSRHLRDVQEVIESHVIDKCPWQPAETFSVSDTKQVLMFFWGYFWSKIVPRILCACIPPDHLFSQPSWQHRHPKIPPALLLIRSTISRNVFWSNLDLARHAMGFQGLPSWSGQTSNRVADLQICWGFGLVHVLRFVKAWELSHCWQLFIGAEAAQRFREVLLGRTWVAKGQSCIAVCRSW